jgi:hypothetical protein
VPSTFDQAQREGGYAHPSGKKPKRTKKKNLGGETAYLGDTSGGHLQNKTKKNKTKKKKE